jgi:ornithine cyclodeaminase/alanine dehydrogenase-like protein (mu-crystallin family)
MPTPPLILHEPEIRALLDPVSCIEAVERAFVAYAAGRAELPGVIHLDVPEARGEVHVKAGYVHGGGCWAVKVATGFPENPGVGLPANSGIVLAFDAHTGLTAAVLFDGGYLTDLRTAAAGAVAVKHLAKERIGGVAVVGAGAQARLQVQLLAHVRRFESLSVWGRRRSAAEQCLADLRASGALTSGVRAQAAETPEMAVRDADLVYTVTPSRAPIVRAEWLGDGSLVVAVGSDGANKQELDVTVLARADRVVADSLPQCRRIGEIHHAFVAGVLDEAAVTELGQIVSGAAPGRRSDAERIVCDLTGVGVQDVAAAALVLERARRERAGEG